MKKLTFGKILFIYASVFLLVILILGVIVWDKLESYQNDYNTAKANGSPILCADELIDNWNRQTVQAYIEKYGVNNVGEYNSISVLTDFFVPSDKKITYKPNEKYTEIMPIYDIYADDLRLAIISLKPEGSNDEFGFHKWQVKNIIFDTNAIKTQNYTVKVMNDCTVTVNGTKLTDKDISRTYSLNDTLDKWVTEKYNYTVSFTEYNLNDCITIPDIKAADSNGNIITECKTENTLIEYTYTSDESFAAAVQPRVLDTVHSYINNIYSKASFYQMSQYLVKDSEAYKIVQDVQPSIVWGWKPDIVEIMEENVSDYVEYSDTLFSCKYYGKIYKADANEQYEEIFNYHLLFEKINGEYYLIYFNIL